VARSRRPLLAALAALLTLSLIGEAPAFQKPQDQPALVSDQAARSPLLSVAHAGSRIVAVGLRGHIVFSDDMGKSWKQATVPVSSDLLAVSFPSARHGWAVGQGGVVLHTADGGTTWTRQLEGRQAAEIATRHYDQSRASDPPSEVFFKREQRLSADGGTQAFLDVHFESETSGFVVGTFNRIFRTDDGGKTWTPWMHRTDNPQELHFYAMRGGAAGLYLAGEQGTVWRFDAASKRFLAIPTPYKGTLFGLVTDGADTLLAFGMRGSLFRSGDKGASWARVNMASSAGITGGTVLADGSVLLVTQAGGIELSRDHGLTFSAVKPALPMPYFGVTALGERRIGLVGAAGVRLEPIGFDATAPHSARPGP